MWVGWVTPDYHQHDMNFDLTKVRAVTVTMGDEQGNIHSRYEVGDAGRGTTMCPSEFLCFLLQSSAFFSGSSYFSASPFSISSFLPPLSPPSSVHSLLSSNAIRFCFPGVQGW